MKNLFIKTYGCQMNVYDSSKIADVLKASHQLELCDQVEDADVILLNTCSIREKAQEKVFSELGRYKKLKDKNPALVIGVGGCVASQEGATISKRAPYVDLIFGPQTLHRLPHLLNQVKLSSKAAIDVSFPEIEKFDNLPHPRAEGPIAFVSIMEGCSKYCSFCIVPYTRGEEISRPFDDVITEISELATQGVREINLLGQNVNEYCGVMHDQSLCNLALLIHFCAAIDGIERIRFTTSHPNAFSESLICAYAEEKKLANHLHLPVQSGSDRILALMKRNYTALEYRSKIRALRLVRPNISLSSDFIVGFPGETSEDFQKTMALIEHIGFDHSFSFIYSPRPGTPASLIPDDVSMDTKKKRLKELQTLLNEQEQRISQSMVDNTEEVLILGPSKRNPARLTARTENNRVVHLTGPDNLIGQIVPVKIIEAKPFSLHAILIES